MLSSGSVVLTTLLAVATAEIPTIPTLHPGGPNTNGIVAAADGTVYFVDSFSETVWRTSPSGATTPFVTGRNGRALQVDERGGVYGLHREDDGSLTVWRAGEDGVVHEVGRPAVPQQYGHAFVMGTDDAIIGFTGTGKRTGVRLWQARDRERELIAGGSWGLRDGAAADARFHPIGGMTRDARGDLLVTSGATVRRVSADGKVSTIAADVGLLEPKHSFLSRLLGDVQGHLTSIASSPDGSIHVTNAARGTVIRIGPDGAVAVVARSGPGWSPTGVATANGVLYVLEYGAGVRVRRIGPDGSAQVVARVRPQNALVAAAASGWFTNRS